MTRSLYVASGPFLQCLRLVHCRLPGLCLYVTDADVFNTTESDQESLDNSASASDHMFVDGDYDENSPGDTLPSKRARTASSSSYAEFISGTASRNAAITSRCSAVTLSEIVMILFESMQH